MIMKTTFPASVLALLALPALAGVDLPSTLQVSADVMAADNVTADLVASGHVHAVAKPLSLLSDLVEKRGDDYRFAPGTLVTTCTNDASCLHWSGTGEISYHGTEGARYAVARNMTLRAFGVPVMWFPFWYYPLDTDYGWRVMPGYSSKWGAYLLTKYVYHLAGSFGPDAYGLSGSTRFDLRSKNGIALGQGLDWQLGSFGRGKAKVYYAWDRDSDTYKHHWNSSDRWHNENWGSSVPDERYALMLEHAWEATERDTVRMKGSYYSDSHFRSDFLRDGLFGHANRFRDPAGNELAWEHLENAYGLGLSVSGPMNDFYGGTARLPEAYFDAAPQPLFGLPVNWESENRVGFLNRNYALSGTRETAAPFRFRPGEWADYQTFRFDTYHRLTAPFKVADVVSVVPRVGLRGTFWKAAGHENLDGYGRAGTVDSDVWRTVVEGGVTFAARGQGTFDGGWTHVIEPYLDVLAQEADYHGLARGQRPLVFDSLDASVDWLDQFAGRSRNLPYSWYGVTPGLRNALRVDRDGRSRTVFDVDVYAAVQFNDTDWTEGGRYHRLARDPRDPNYGKDRNQVMPGVRVRWTPAESLSLLGRVECDTENGDVAYADLALRHTVSEDFKWHVLFTNRDYRRWDFASTPYDAGLLRDEGFNWSRLSYLDVGFEHEVCDAFAWGPFVRWDCHDGELDEIGTWFDLRTDCLGFRFSVSYEKEYRRIDWSKSSDDWRCGFFVYLRALGPGSGSPF